MKVLIGITPHSIRELKDVSPDNVYADRKEETLKAKADKKAKTLARRKAINPGVGNRTGKVID